MLKLLSYPKSILAGPFGVVWTLVCAVLVLLCVGLGWSKEALFFVIKNLWAKTILAFTGVETEFRGIENLPTGGFLYVFNHTSHYDILVIFAGTPRICYFGAKAELFKIPLFGRAMTAGGALRIERANRNKVMKVYKEAEERVAKGDVFALAPEGTRQAGHGYLAPFKSGPFFFAMNAKMPIVPVVLVGCEKVLSKKGKLPNWGYWKRKVIFECLPAVYPQTISDEEARRLKDQTYLEMSERLKEYWSTSSPVTSD